MVVVSLRANYLFGSSLGQTRETAQVFGWANVAADVWKVLGLIIIVRIWRQQQRVLAACLMPIWFLCFGWGLIGAIGVYAQDRTAITAMRETRARTLLELEKDLAAIEAERKRLPVHRSSIEIEAAIASVLTQSIAINDRVQRTVGSLSNNCAKPERLTIAPCAKLSELQADAATARRAEQLEQKRDMLRHDVRRLRDSGAAVSPDPLADILSWISRGNLDRVHVAYGFPLAFAVLIELISALGPAGLVAYVAAGHGALERGEPRRGELGQGRARDGATEHVVAWMSERTEPAENSPVSDSALYADYVDWCADRSELQVDPSHFRQEFERVCELPGMAGRIRRSGKHYIGIRLSVVA